MQTISKVVKYLAVISPFSVHRVNLERGRVHALKIIVHLLGL